MITARQALPATGQERGKSEARAFFQTLKQAVPKTEGETDGEWKARALRANAPNYRAALIAELDPIRQSMSREDFDLARAVITRFGSRVGSQCRKAEYNLARAVSFMAAVSFPGQEVAGHVIVPAVPALASKLPTEFMARTTVLRRSDLSTQDFQSAWQAVSRNGVAAMLADEMLAISMPPILWPALIALIKDGPGSVHQRLAEVLYQRGNAGPAGELGVARSTLECSYAAPVNTLARVLIDLRTLGFPHDALEPWQATLPIIDCSAYASAGEGDVDAPPLEVVRATIKPWYEKMMRVTRNGTHLPHGLFRELRDGLIASIFILTGSRKGALEGMRIRDYQEVHAWPDARIPPGPAVLLDIAKTGLNAGMRWKAIVPELVPLMRLYMTAAGIEGQPDHQPLWVGWRYKRILSADSAPQGSLHIYPKIAGDRKSYQRSVENKRRRLHAEMSAAGVDENDITRALAEVIGDAGLPFFPRPGCPDPSRGYRCHSTRASGNQHLTAAAELYLASPEGRRDIGLAADKHALAQSVLDHEIAKGDRHQYGLCAPLKARECNSARLAPWVWSLIAGDAGAPRGIDVIKVRDLRQKYTAAIENVEVTARKIHQIEDEAASERASVMRGSGTLRRSQISKEALLDRYLSDLARIEEIDKRNRHARRLAVAAHEQAEEARDELRDLLREAETTEVPLMYLEDPDFDKSLLSDDRPSEEDGAESLRRSQRAVAPVRGFVFARELANVMFGEASTASIQRINAWLRPKSYPKVRTSSVPWTKEQLEAGEVVDGSLNGKHRRILVSSFNWDRLSVHQQQELRAVLATQAHAVAP